MKIAGIVAEYNPLHNGHVYHMEETKKLTGCDALVVAMSGDFVQRGEPAITDKWTRARHALMAGADLVIEIPTYYCLGNAGQYASAGVKLLESLGKVSHLSFGSECGDRELLERVTRRLVSGKDDIAELTRKLGRSGLSYPAAREAAYKELFGEVIADGETEVLSSSNDILGIEYMLATDSLEPVPVRREGASYNDEEASGGLPSAASVRSSLKKGEDIEGMVPEYVREGLEGSGVTITDDWLDILKYAVLTSTAESIEDCPSGGEGLGNLLREAALSANSWQDLIMSIKSRRYTYTRLSRLCMQVILGIYRRDLAGVEGPEYIRVLGAGAKGRELLAEIRNDGSATLPVVTNINKEQSGISGSRLLELDVRAADIYNLVTGRDTVRCSDHRMSPVML